MTTIAIAGAGIAGLTAALALAEAGLGVQLVEAAANLGEAGAGVQLSPNATRVLRRLGLLDAVADRAVRPEMVRIRRGRDGGDLALLPLGEAAERRYGAPFLLAHRGDLHGVLLGAVRGRPAIALTTGTRLQVADLASDGVAITLAAAGGGPPRSLSVDGLIGADGLRSAVRRRVVGGHADPLAFSGRTAWRALLPAAEAPEHARRPASNLWLGAGAHLVHYPVRGGALINVVAIVDGSRHDEGGDAWAMPGEARLLLPAFAGWCRDARAVLEAAADWRVWPLYDRKPLARWAMGPVVLAGDAAHPMLPFLAQGAAQAIEDGGAIGAAAAGAASFSAAAVAYQRIRRPIADRVQRESRRQGVVYHLAPPASAARDAAFRWLGAERMLARYDWLYGAPARRAVTLTQR